VDRRLALTAASAALAVFTAACGGSAAASQSAAPTVAASAAASPSPTATEVAVASTAPSASDTGTPSAEPGASGAIPSITIPNQDTNLEALLPSEFAGTKLQKLSMKGSQYLGQGSNSELGQVVSQLGLTTADVSVAIASATGNAKAPIFVAVRFAGADSGKLLQVFQAATVSSGAVVTPVNVAGKDVLKTADKTGTISYFYVHNDVVVGVTAKDDATAVAGLALLP